MAIVLYNTFFFTFLSCSLFCYWIDFYFPYLRVNGDKVSSDIVLRDYKNMAPLVLFNLFFAYPFFYTTQNYILRYDKNDENNFPVFVNCLLWIAGTDVFFYTIHFLFHHRYFYAYHKIHHTYKYTYGMGAIYAHPSEFYLANLLPAALPMFIFKIPLWLCDWIVLFSTFFTIVISHGGFKIRMGRSHLNHHLKFNYNYGLLKMDQIMGTVYTD